ncbi:hypothetical protein [Mycolicibacterium sp. P1-18]|uniref:hypothetical protein n=1 Tax=Mycolicibacterium sp. P1-18 TaxID=2024615 RepID=UPI001565406A|nr:hypothetical protein [Mycolicibacterium sp. P1-18]
MSTAGAAPPITSSAVEADEGDERVVVVYTCTRLGLTANPPGFSFLDLFRFGRFRRR